MRPQGLVLSPTVQTLLDAHRHSPDLARSLNHALIVSLEGAVSVAVLTQAYRQVCARHEVLHTQLSADGTAWIVDPRFQLELAHLPDVTNDAQRNERDLIAAVRQAMARPRDLSKEALTSASLFTIDDNSSVLLLTSHQAACDLSALGTIAIDLGEHYQQNLVSAARAKPETLRVQASRIGRAGANSDAANAYWMANTAACDLDATRLSPTRVQSADHNTGNWHSSRADLEIDRATTKKLQQLARSDGVTIAEILTCALAILISRLTGSSKVSFQCRPDNDPGIIEPPSPPLPVTFQIDLNATGQESLQAIAATLKKVQAHPIHDITSLRKQMRRIDAAVESKAASPACYGCGVALSFVQSLNPDLLDFGDLRASAMSVAADRHANELDLVIVDQSDYLLLECQYHTARFDEHMISSWLGGYRAILIGLADEKMLPVGILEILDPRHQQMLAALSEPSILDQLPELPSAPLREQALARGDKTALNSPVKQLTFHSLDAISNQLASCLLERGLRAGDCAAMALNDNVQRCVAAWACSKVGIAFVALNTQLAIETQSELGKHSKAGLLISNSQISRAPFWPAENTLLLDTQFQEVGDQSTGPPAAPHAKIGGRVGDTSANSAGKNGQHPAYFDIVQRLGTREDLCVAVSRDALSNLLHFAPHIWHISPGEKVLCVNESGLATDLIASMAVSACGGCAYFPDHTTLASAVALKSYLEEHQISRMLAPANAWARLLGLGWPSESTLQVIVTGAQLSQSLTRTLLQEAGVIKRVFGFAESGYCSLAADITDPLDWAVIGRPQPNCQVRILDQRAQLCPIGANGEILLGGPCISTGYINAALLSSEQFVPDLFSDNPSRRLYRTGITGRWNARGMLEVTSEPD